MGPAHQGQVPEVGGAAVDPVPPMMALAPGQGPITAGEDAAAVADGQGAPLGWGDGPGGPAEVQGWLGAPPRVRGNKARAARSRPWRAATVLAGVVAAPVAGAVVAGGPDVAVVVVSRAAPGSGPRPSPWSVPGPGWG